MIRDIHDKLLCKSSPFKDNSISRFINANKYQKKNLMLPCFNNIAVQLVYRDYRVCWWRER